MREETTFLPPRISTTSSIGMSTRPILSCKLNADTRLSRLSLTFFSKPEYVWMMYHCIAVKLCTPSDAENFEDAVYAKRYKPIHNRQKNAEEKYRGDDHAGRGDHVLTAGPRYLLHFHAHVVQKFARILERSRDLLADASRRPGDCIALRLFVLHFDRLRGHSPSSTDRRRCLSLISGRGGGTRTPIPGFGDRSPSRWTTPLKNPKPLRPTACSKTGNYLTSLCPVCLRHVLQNFRVSTRSECFFLFLVVV